MFNNLFDYNYIKFDILNLIYLKNFHTLLNQTD